MIYFISLWNIMRELAPWLLFGAIIGGALHVLVPSNFIKKHLGGNTWWSVIKASFIGVPLPLCSCSVIPTGIGLKKDGASDGAAISFLISTPQTGIDSISVAAGFLGWPFAIFKVLSAFAMGIIGGQLVNILGKKNDTADTGTDNSAHNSPAIDPHAGHAHQQQPSQEGASCCAPSAKSSKFKQAVVFAFDDLLRMIWLWLIIGVLISAAMNTFIDPGSLAGYTWATGIYAMLIMLLISLPLYVCATASVPIAAALIAAGLPTGAALVFLMAGPASNVATIGAIAKAFGLKITAVYLAVVILGSMALGYAFDRIISADLISAEQLQQHHAAWWADAAAIILCLCFVYFAYSDLKAFLSRKQHQENKKSCCH